MSAADRALQLLVDNNGGQVLDLAYRALFILRLIVNTVSGYVDYDEGYRLNALNCDDGVTW